MNQFKRILICGGRDFEDWVSFCSWMLDLQLKGLKPEIIIEGGAKGADIMGRNWAIDHNVPYEEYKADWDKYGRRAGPLRNIQMLEEGKPDLVIATPGGRGTEHMKKLARAAGVEVIEFDLA